ncbi:hypothetical protein GCM10029978_066900 [Actinoallomurus acanthiterrae]
MQTDPNETATGHLALSHLGNDPDRGARSLIELNAASDTPIESVAAEESLTSPPAGQSVKCDVSLVSD